MTQDKLGNHTQKSTARVEKVPRLGVNFRLPVISILGDRRFH